MKKLMYTAAIAILTIGATQAQEKIEETTTTRTTVKSSLGNETVVKKETVTAVTPTKLDPQDSGELNQNQVESPTMIKRKITYTYNDSDFNLTETKDGYTITRTRENDASEYGTMRELAKGDVYMMKTIDGISVSYFDENGNMVSEKYNDADDSMTITTFEKKQPKTTKMNKM